MVEIKLEGVDHIYEPGTPKETHAIKDISWTAPSGSTTALLGPSGCGKTTLLKIISGLLTPTEGKVYFDDEDVTELPPQERDIAQVFQFPVVYEVRDVYGNLAFPLENKGMPEEEIERKVKNVAEMLELEDIHRSANDLNTTQKQLVSLGRGVIREDASAILLDEPMTDVDPRKRANLRRRIKRVQKKSNITMIYVTHDQHEALSFAKNVSVMKEGKILQTGPAEELYSSPRYDFIGHFIGTPGMNFLSCSLSGDELDFGAFTLPLTEEERSTLSEYGSEFRLGIRPADLEVNREEQGRAIEFVVSEAVNRGNHLVVNLKKNGVEMKSRTPTEVEVEQNDRVWVEIPKDKIKIYRKDTGELIL